MHHYFYLCKAKHYGSSVDISGVFSSPTRIMRHEDLNDVRKAIASGDANLAEIHLKNISYLGSDDEARPLCP